MKSSNYKKIYNKNIPTKLITGKVQIVASVLCHSVKFVGYIFNEAHSIFIFLLLVHAGSTHFILSSMAIC